jgi:RNA polymerase sigma factor (TIGR02999 family)
LEEDLTGLLNDWRRAKPGADDELLAAVYGELRALAVFHFRSERSGHTLHPPAIVHEPYIRLLGQRQVDWKNRRHFFAVASSMMRRLLVDHARAHKRAKRGGGEAVYSLDLALDLPDQRAEDVVALHQALDALAKFDREKASVVEMRCFGGLTVEEVAEVLDCSARTIAREWLLAKAWLSVELGGEG